MEIGLTSSPPVSPIRVLWILKFPGQENGALGVYLPFSLFNLAF